MSDPSHTDLLLLLDSWSIHLQAEHKSAETIASYRAGVLQYLASLGKVPNAGEPLSPRSVNAWVVSLLQAGRAPKTAAIRQGAVRQFSKWLADEGEIDRDLLLGIRPPKVPTPVIRELSEDELRALIKACKGSRLGDRRDEAIVRLMAECGARAGEIIAMHVPDVDVRRGLAVIRRGKGGKGRHVPFGPQTGASLDRYLRARRKHPLAATPVLWLGERGREFRYDALRMSLRKRAKAAGIDGFTPHQLRHTFAGRWLELGGTEGGLMSVAGWSRRELIDRYTRQTSEKRAADEARRLGLGDL